MKVNSVVSKPGRSLEAYGAVGDEPALTLSHDDCLLLARFPMSTVRELLDGDDLLGWLP